MKKKLLGLMVLVLTLSFSATAQNADQIKKQINSIKKSSQYLYAEATCATAEDARVLAEEMLETEVNKYVASKKNMRGKAIVLADRKDLLTMLSLPRGNMFRAFTYISKADIIPAGNAKVIEGNPEAGLSTVQLVWPEAVTTLAAYTDYYKMADKLKELKGAGKVATYDRYQKLTKPENYYLVIYNRQGQVVAILSPGTQRTNVKTGKPDDLKNFNGNDCGAIGFIAN